MLKLTRWCIAHRGRVFVAWLVVAILTTVVGERCRAQLRHELHPARNAVAEGARPAQEGVPRAERRRRHDRVPRRERHGRRPAGKGGDDRPARQGLGRPARRLGAESVRSGWSGAGLARPQDRVRDDQLRPPGQRRPERRRQTRARPDRGGERAGAEDRRRRSGDGERRGLQRGPGDPDRWDRRADHPAVHFRLARRRGDAADHRRIRPDHRGRPDRAGHARHEHPERLDRPRADDRARRRGRLRAVHRHALP